MIDGKVLLVALMALCVADLMLIWQMSTLADRVDDVQEDMHATAGRLARELDRAHGSKEYRLRVFGQKDGGNDDED